MESLSARQNSERRPNEMILSARQNIRKQKKSFFERRPNA